jgi:pentatricopeptide repeat protein
VDYARGAGDQAVELLAFDQAVTFFRQALDAADDVEASEAVRCDLLVRLGNAQRLAGIRAHRETLLEAAALAQQVGDADLLARAALANHRGLFSMAGQVDEERVAVLEAALAGAGPDDSPTRARLLAVLAQEMTWRDPQQRRFEFADEALAMARRVGDDACLLQVWTARQHSHWVADRLPALVAELPELLALADRVGDAQSRVLASAWGFIHALDLGDIETADRLLARNAEVVAEFNHPSFRWLHANYRCCRMMINGTGDEIEAGATEALRLGQDAGEPDAFIWFAPQLFWAREAQGRLPEIIDLVRQETAANPGLPTWKLVLAYGLVKVGEVDEARKLVEEMTSSGIDPLPYDMLWLLAQVNLGMVLGAVGSPEAAAAQHERLLPYAGRLAAIGTIAQRSVHYALALLAVRAGWADGAEQHFADASAQYEAIGADLWLAEARLAWARLLLARGEVDRARVLLTEARAGAERMAAHHVAAEASALLE